MSNTPQTPAGLFLLKLNAPSAVPGAPSLELVLSVYTPQEAVTGHAVVTQALAQPVVCNSHVTGTVIPEYVMAPGISKIRINLKGTGHIGTPVTPLEGCNFKATILLSANYEEGSVHYDYLSLTSGWHHVDGTISKVR